MSYLKPYWTCFLFLIFMASPGFDAPAGTQTAQPAAGNEEREYSAVEIDGTLCGYSESWTSTIVKDGRTLEVQESEVQVLLSALGVGVDMVIRTVAHLIPSTEQAVYCDMTVEQAGVRVGGTVEVLGSTARWTSKSGGGAREVELPADAILGIPGFHPGLHRDFVRNRLDRKDYQVFDVMRGELQKAACTLKGREKLELAGSTFDAFVLEEINQGLGIKYTLWLDSARDRILKTAFLNRVIYLAKASVKKEIRRASLDNSLFFKANVSIKDVFALSFMKVKAVINTAGEPVSAESLNVPGQRFTGTVADNLIDGVFEISYPRFDGKNAPAFPPDFRAEPSLNRYLRPDRLIESDDPAIISKAGELTAGSKDSWEAARRLCRWVADTIGYDIPGGSSARNTLVSRQGECGGHSRLLVALCRASGIPARLATGCMYTYHKGGSFGSHAWTEVYMGPGGWVPVDSTASQIDYVDSGHIRLGQEALFMPKSMEILDYRGATSKPASPPAVVSVERYAPYLGKYSVPEAPAERAVIQVLLQNGGLALDVPFQTAFELKDPDTDGIWYFKITDRHGVSFRKDASGPIDGLTIFETVMAPRVENSAPVSAEVPVALQPYSGEYRLPMNRGVIRVMPQEGRLALEIPQRGTIRLKDPDSRRRWYDQRETGAYAVFDQEGAGYAARLTLFIGNFVPRGVLAAHLVEQVLKNQGLDAALRKYQELRDNPPADCRFTEDSFNLLAYRTLNRGRIPEAIALFELNAAAYPRSSNAYGCLAEAYRKKGDTAKVIENYRKAVELDPANEIARKNLEQLEKTP
jgi:transglutaminase-like putative cysteine protease